MIIIFFVVFIRFTIKYLNAKNVSIAEPFILYLREIHDNTSCHFVEEGDVLQSAENPKFSLRPNSIFFHETSCRGGLNSRQACAVESASRAHPERQVNVMFSGPVSELVYQKSCIRKLREFPNIRFARVHIYEYAKKTPLEEMVASESFKKSKRKVEATANIMRFLTLYKWGGVYLDLDIIVVRPFTPLGHNWAAWEDHQLVNTAAIAISMDFFGSKFSEAMLNELRTNYKPGYNDRQAVTRVFRKMCNLSHRYTNTCKGIKILDREYIYPIHYKNYTEYFLPEPLTNVDKAYTHHLWNKWSYQMEVDPDSAYAELARKFCPTIYEMYGDKFGFLFEQTILENENPFGESSNNSYRRQDTVKSEKKELKQASQIKNIPTVKSMFYEFAAKIKDLFFT